MSEQRNADKDREIIADAKRRYASVSPYDWEHWSERAVSAEQRVAELEKLVVELDEKLTDAENEIAWRRG